MLVLIDSVGSLSIESCCLQIGTVWFLLPPLCLSLVLLLQELYWIRDVRASILISFFILEEMLLYSPLVWCCLYLCRIYTSLFWGMFTLFLMPLELLSWRHIVIFQIIFIINWDDHVVSVFKFFICVLYLIELYMLLLLNEVY